jgi:excisionase family DNA binding protein
MEAAMKRTLSKEKVALAMAYSLGEAATVLKLSRPTVSKLIKDGALRARRVGRRVIVSHEALAEFLGDKNPTRG